MLEMIGRYSEATTLAGIAVLAVGLLWAPLGGWLATRLARSNGRRVTTWEGAQASLLFMLPWILMMAQLAGRPIPERALRIGYLLCFGVWLAGPLAFAVTHAIAEVAASAPFSPRDDLLVAWGVSLMGVIVNGLLWFDALQDHLRTQMQTRAPAEGDTASATPSIYRSPFRPAVASFLFTWLLIVLIKTSLVPTVQ